MNAKSSHILIIVFLVIISQVACSSSSSSNSSSEASYDNTDSLADTAEPESTVTNIQDTIYGPHVLYPGGVEIGDASRCEAPSGRKCLYVYSEAPDGGDGSFQRPFNSFEEAVSYRDLDNSIRIGLLRGGDYLYVRGRFSASKHEQRTSNQQILLIGSEFGGSRSSPTVIKSWPGFPRAVFDGEYQLNDSITIYNVGGEGSAVRVENIEVTQALGRSIFIAEGTHYVDIVGLVAHHTQGNGILGIGGAVMFKIDNGLRNFTVTNSLFHNNNVEITGHPNNVGAVGITSEITAFDGSSVEVAYNIFQNEEIAIRQKHSGNITMDAHHNLIMDSQFGFHLRAFDNQIRNNQLQNVHTAFRVEENDVSNCLHVISDNEILDSETFLEKYANSVFLHDYSVNDNYFRKSSFSRPVLVLGEYSRDIFNTAGWQSARNIFDAPSNDFMILSGRRYSFSSAMEVLGDSGSRLE